MKFFAKNLKNTTWAIIFDRVMKHYTTGWRQRHHASSSVLAFWNCSEPVHPLIMRLITTSWCVVQAKVISRKTLLFITLKWSPPEHSLVFGQVWVAKGGFSNQTSWSWSWVVISTSAFQTTNPRVHFEKTCYLVCLSPLEVFVSLFNSSCFTTPPPCALNVRPHDLSHACHLTVDDN